MFFTDAFTDSALSAKVNGEHKEKDLEPWGAGELTASEELELENDVVSALCTPALSVNVGRTPHVQSSTFSGQLLKRERRKEFLPDWSRSTLKLLLCDDQLLQGTDSYKMAACFVLNTNRKQVVFNCMLTSLEMRSRWIKSYH